MTDWQEHNYFFRTMKKREVSASLLFTSNIKFPSKPYPTRDRHTPLLFVAYIKAARCHESSA